MSPLSQLHSVTTRLLDASPADTGTLFSIEQELYDLLMQATGMDERNDTHRKHISLASGKAIGSIWAALCIKDIHRTKRFMDGTYAATKTISNRPIHILYAGTGPFATLVLPLTAYYTSEELQFTFLEINEESIAALEHTLQHLNLTAYARRIEKADATQWKLPANERVDIFVCETIQQALTNEPQVSIYLNIIPQLQERTIIIPEKIELYTALIDTAGQMEYKLGTRSTTDFVEMLAPVFELNRATAVRHAEAFKQSTGEYDFPLTSISIPPEKSKIHRQLCICTEITVYHDIKLLMDECILTAPFKLMDNPPATMQLRYHAGKNPGLKTYI